MNAKLIIAISIAAIMAVGITMFKQITEINAKEELRKEYNNKYYVTEDYKYLKEDETCNSKGQVVSNIYYKDSDEQRDRTSKYIKQKGDVVKKIERWSNREKREGLYPYRCKYNTLLSKWKKLETKRSDEIQKHFDKVDKKLEEYRIEGKNIFDKKRKRY